MSDRPGSELPKEYREVALDLTDNQGWRYTKGKKHGMLYPPDKTQDPVTVSTTPSTNPRALKNFIAQVRRSGGVWPPAKKGK
jgi:hypothetical protein